MINTNSKGGKMKKLEVKYIVAIIISIILGASILGYGYIDYKYKKEALEQKIVSDEQEKLEREIKEEREKRSAIVRQAQLQNCLDEVSNRFGNAINNMKDTENISYEGVKIIFDLFQKQRDECFRKYPQQ